jgi:hypothetical protein
VDMKCLTITEIKEVCLVKNKTLVINMQHVKWKEIPPLKGPDSQGLNVPLKQATTIKNSENINGRNRQTITKRKY